VGTDQVVAVFGEHRPRDGVGEADQPFLVHDDDRVGVVLDDVEKAPLAPLQLAASTLQLRRQLFDLAE
jgi:hypothetical protein